MKPQRVGVNGVLTEQRLVLHGLATGTVPITAHPSYSNDRRFRLSLVVSVRRLYVGPGLLVCVAMIRD